MPILPNNNNVMKALTSDSVLTLKACSSIKFSNAFGGTLAYGYDDNDNIIIIVYGDSKIEIETRLNHSIKNKPFL